MTNKVLLLCAFLLILLNGCNNKETPDNPTEAPVDLTIEVEDFSVAVGETAAFKIVSGSGDYSVALPAIGVAQAKVEGDVVNVSGITSGEQTLTVIDNVSKQVKSIPLVVTETFMLRFSHKEVTSYVGKYTVVTILNGSGKYEVSVADPKIVEATLRGKSITIRMDRLGETKVIVKDVERNATRELPVTVTKSPLIIDREEMSIFVGEPQEFKITSGNNEYEITVDKPEIVTVEQELPRCRVVAHTSGEAIITVKDLGTNEQKQIRVTSAFKPLVVDREEMTIEVSQKKPLTVKSGSGRYTAQADKPSLISVTADPEDPARFIVEALSVGQAVITLTDDASKETKTIQVEVQSSPFVVGGYSKMPIFANSKEVIHITKGNGRYTARIEGGSGITASVEGNKVVLDITAPEGTKATLVVTDDVIGEEFRSELTVWNQEPQFQVDPESIETGMRDWDGYVNVIQNSKNYQFRAIVENPTIGKLWTYYDYWLVYPYSSGHTRILFLEEGTDRLLAKIPLFIRE